MAGLASAIRTLELSDGELSEMLGSPFAGQHLADPRDLIVVITTPDGSRPGPQAVATLAALPCIVIGDGHDPRDPPDWLDLVIDTAVAGTEEVLAVVDANPIASVTLALVLRGAENRTLAEGLVAESAAYSVLQAGPEFARWRERIPARRRESGTGPVVGIERSDERLSIVLDRPQVHNALNLAMRDELLAAFALVAADESIRQVTVRGNGPSFCSGGDLDEFGTFDDPASAHLVRLAASVGRAIAAVAERTTFVLHGSCAGSGIELPAFAGIVQAHPDTTLSLPEMTLGLVPGAGGTVSLTRRAGRHRVALLALSGARISAETALDWGLVDEVVGGAGGLQSPSGSFTSS